MCCRPERVAVTGRETIVAAGQTTNGIARGRVARHQRLPTDLRPSARRALARNRPGLAAVSAPTASSSERRHPRCLRVSDSTDEIQRADSPSSDESGPGLAELRRLQICEAGPPTRSAVSAQLTTEAAFGRLSLSIFPLGSGYFRHAD